ncbi:cation:proton antiporter [Streptomyces sp. uw30]|uniref:cation:proton antiporter domain-containing protein n=1 Tax=Streptomyces sp. uw30 TaxID=1828179 RepID=UPI0021C85275|nr:cation:proton antiporter [Streptomyces sp. uw30]
MKASTSLSAEPEATLAPRRMLLGYGAFVGIPVGLTALILASIGYAGPTGHAPADSGAVPLYRILGALALVTACAAAAGALARRIGQPRVVGEIAAALLLGPSVFGALLPDAQRWLLPPEVFPFLNTLGQLGVTLFMFTVGRELSLTALRRDGLSASTLIGHSGIAIPFLTGVLVALALPDSYRPAGVGTVPFVLFLGLSLSVTAVPVLARLLSDEGKLNTRLGTLAMASASVADVTAWCLLALVLAIASGGSLTAAAVTVGWVVLFGLVVWRVLRPLLVRLLAAKRPDGPMAAARTASIVLVTVLLCALATEQIGVHALFGAVAAGLAMPRTEAVEQIAWRVEGLTSWMLLPSFFMAVGLSTHLGAVHGATGWLICLAVLAAAAAAKFVATVVPARLLRFSWRESAQLGAMMNCRGLTELIILNTGLAAGLLSPALFAMLVVMALATTAMTGPLLRLMDD